MAALLREKILYKGIPMRPDIIRNAFSSIAVKKLLVILGYPVLVSACTPQYTCSHYDDPLPRANAGCFIVSNGKLLVTQQRSGLWNLPGGTAKTGENAQCTAERETWEETGLRIHVDDLARVFDNGFHLFHCHADDATASPTAIDAGEVQDIRWLDPREFSDYAWRFPKQVFYMRSLLSEVSE